MKKLVWSRLKDFKCPKCSKVLNSNPNNSYYCIDCGFVIGKEKFEDIINNKKKSVDVEIDNQEALNNL